MRKVRLIILSLTILVGIVGWHDPVFAAPGDTTCVSIASDGSLADDRSSNPSISADGRYVVFESDAENLVDGDTNNDTDIFVHDRQAGQTTLVSVASYGNQANDNSYEPVISANGVYVAFESLASNLILGDNNNQRDIFVHNRVTGQTSRISVDSNDIGGNAASFFPAISADGRYVVFESRASNLVPNDTNGKTDIFVHDRQMGKTTLVSESSTDKQANGSSYYPSISADGNLIVFVSAADNLVSADRNYSDDIFVRDQINRKTFLISVSSDGKQAASWSSYPAISADGHFVVFMSQAENLVSDDHNMKEDIFVHDIEKGQTTRVSVTSDGMEANGKSYYYSAISANGRFAVFMSDATNLVQGDTNGDHDIFVHDRQTGQTVRVSVASDGIQGNDGSYFPDISANGQYVVFGSQASNLIDVDNNYVPGIFVHHYLEYCYLPIISVSD